MSPPLQLHPRSRAVSVLAATMFVTFAAVIHGMA
jgi:hypothetical protein